MWPREPWRAGPRRDLPRPVSVTALIYLPQRLGARRTSAWSAWEQVVGDGYALWALAALVWCARRGRRAARRGRHAGAVPGDLRIRGSVVVPEAELSWRFSRSSGPGGQGVNTTDSRVELSLDVATTSALSPYLRERALDRLADRLVDGVLTVSASEQRSQWQNRLSAERKLADAARRRRSLPRRARGSPTKPSASARRRRVDDKKRRGQIKQLRRADPD